MPQMIQASPPTWCVMAVTMSAWQNGQLVRTGAKPYWESCRTTVGGVTTTVVEPGCAAIRQTKYAIITATKSQCKRHLYPYSIYSPPFYSWRLVAGLIVCSYSSCNLKSRSSLSGRAFVFLSFLFTPLTIVGRSRVLLVNFLASRLISHTAERRPVNSTSAVGSTRKCGMKNWHFSHALLSYFHRSQQDAQLSQRDRAAGYVI